MVEDKEIVEGQLKLASDRVKSFLVPTEILSEPQARLIIGTYRVAIEPNFIQWMTQAYENAKSQKAKIALKKNIVDEISQDHPKMLRDFAQDCGVVLSPLHYQRASQPSLDIWNLFTRRDSVMNLGIAAALENTSLLFIPYITAL